MALLPVEPVSTTLIHTSRCRADLLDRMSKTVGLLCSMARVANSTMTADEVTENIEATVKTFMAKVNMVSALVPRPLVLPHQNVPTTPLRIIPVVKSDDGVITRGGGDERQLKVKVIVFGCSRRHRHVSLFVERTSDQTHPLKE